MVELTPGQRVAVIGAGISGIVAAHVLSRQHQVTLFEAGQNLGGHTNTRVIDSGPDAGTSVDTGFIVCNPRNYPNFYRFLSQLRVELQDSEMSFGFYCERSKRRYLGPSIWELLRAPECLLDLGLLRLFLEQRRFNQRVLADLRNGSLAEQPLAQYLEQLQVSPTFIDDYLTPLIAAIWSSPDLGAREFPAATFAVFFRNHGMLELSTRPQWQTVVGGSHAYLHAFSRSFKGGLRLSCPIQRVVRSSQGVTLYTSQGEALPFDQVILATHANEAFQLLAEPSVEEQQALQSWRYSSNHAVLHWDEAVLSGNRRLWASWNYRRRKSSAEAAPVSVTYYMNRLQNLKTQRHYFVTLNERSAIREERIIYETTYTHPVYTPQSVQAQQQLRELNGRQRTFYCGAYQGYGFHEDGVTSALDVARHFGATL
jgi:predicted NAD/FAD-binding protein